MRLKLPIKIEVKKLEELFQNEFEAIIIIGFFLFFFIFGLLFYDSQIVCTKFIDALAGFVGAVVLSFLIDVFIMYLFSFLFRIRFYAEYDEPDSMIRLTKEQIKKMSKKK